MLLTINLLLFMLLKCPSEAYNPETFDEDVYEDQNGELSPEQLTRYFDNDNPPELMLNLDESWPDQNAIKKLGLITASVPVDAHGLTSYILHRGDREWNIDTFDDNNVFQHISESPISKGILAKLRGNDLESMHFKNRFFMPHGLSVDHEGNIWITDVALHQVFKFSPDLDEKPLMVLGERFQPGNDSEHFCKPTHVVVARNGDFFVSDGYCNNRIIKFHANGTVIKQWGKPTKDSSNPKADELNLPHQMTLLDQDDILCVADRENNRLVCYNAGLTKDTEAETGRFLFEIRKQLVRPGLVFGVAYCPYARTLFALIGNGFANGPTEVQIYDLATLSYVGVVNENKQLYGKAHTISTCHTPGGSGCLIVSSLNEPSSGKRIWFYRMLSSGQI